MKWTAETVYPKPLKYVIEYDESAGYYLYVYDGRQMTHDYLQDTLEIAKDLAREKFHVPLDSWK